MNIEQLTKTQIILLTLLVSFVTSIATGIVTVRLLEQAPPAVTQTINRVVERTVERVVPSENNKTETIKEVTVVVKEEDLITDTIDKNSKRLVRINRSLGGEKSVFVGLGFIVSRDGLVAADSSLVTTGSYFARIHSGEEFPLGIIISGKDASVTILKMKTTEETSKIFSPVAFANTDTLKLGQTVIVLSGEARTDVAIGIISSLEKRDEEVPAEEGKEPQIVSKLSSIGTTVKASSVLSGSPALNIFGEVIGIKMGGGISTDASFIPAKVIQDALNTLITAQAETEKDTNTN